MAALMTSMRLKQVLKSINLVNKATTCSFCSKPHEGEPFRRIRTQHLQHVSSVRSYSTSESTTKPVEDEMETDEQEKAKKARQKKIIKGLKISAVGMGCMSIAILIYEWGTPDQDAEGQPIEDEFTDGWFSYLLRAYKRFTHEVKVTIEPSRQRLLPDPLTYPYLQPKYTLVIEMTNVLVHPDWTYKTGWRFKKRPGIDVFLRAIGPPLFEIVIFTREQGMTADPIITKADPENFIMYRLYRDATRYEDGIHMKDLRYLNRDLSKVIMVDWDNRALKFNPENGFVLNKWDGENNDTTLGELAEFLRAIAISNVDDVRPVLQYYSQFDDPLSKFHENQMKLKEEQDRQAEVMKQQSAKSLTSLSSFWKKR